jgi:hypothetical protein
MLMRKAMLMMEAMLMREAMLMMEAVLMMEAMLIDGTTDGDDVANAATSVTNLGADIPHL